MMTFGPQDEATATAAIECAAALVTVCLEDHPQQHRGVVNSLLQAASDGGYLPDLTAALALGFAANVEAIGKLVNQDPRELWQRWCTSEAQRRSTGRPFHR